MIKQFEFIGGSLCLDFVNTVDCWTLSEFGSVVVVDEKLESYERLVEWSMQAKIITEKRGSQLLKYATRNPEIALKVLSRAHELRAGLWLLLSQNIKSVYSSSEPLTAINLELSKLPSQELVRDGKRLSLERAWAEDSLQIMFGPILEDLTALARSDRLPLVQICSAKECGWLFLDTSKNHKRRWCDMKDCGNREKARRFYKRTQAELRRAS